MRFSFRGVKFEISYLFLCLLILYIAFDKTGLYIPLILCIILHEISHLIFIIFFKSKVKSVKLILGAISIEYVDLYKRYKKIVALLAGPLSNLIAACISLYFKSNEFFSVNLVLLIYNLMPIKGLDGGELLLEIFLYFFEPDTANSIISIVSFAFLICVIVVYFCWFSINISMIIIALYLITPILFKKTLKDRAF